MALTADFYRAGLHVASKMREIPGETDAIIYDPRFSDDEIISDVAAGLDPFPFDVPRFYYTLFMDLAHVARHFNCLIEVCYSDDINEPIERGDFVYYAGPITSEIGVLYMEPTHPIYYPYRCVIYGPEFQFEVSQESKDIKVFPIAEEVRMKIMNPNERIRKEKIFEYLKNTDRPIIFPEDY